MKIRVKHSNKYLSIADDSYTVIQDAIPSEWLFDQKNDNYGYIVLAKYPDKCLQINNMKMLDHAKIDLGTKQEGNYSQLWKFEVVNGENNVFYIINKTKRKEGNIENTCLDVPEGKMDDKVNIIAYHVKNRNTKNPENQWWELN